MNERENIRRDMMAKLVEHGFAPEAVADVFGCNKRVVERAVSRDSSAALDTAREKDSPGGR